MNDDAKTAAALPPAFMPHGMPSPVAGFTAAQKRTRAWIPNAEEQREAKDRERDKFRKYVVRQAAKMRGIEGFQVDAAIQRDKGVCGAAIAEIVPEIPWERAVFVNIPKKGCANVSLSIFFSKGLKAPLELIETALWDALVTSGRDAFIIFKVAGIRGAEDRLFCMTLSQAPLCGGPHGRIIVPQEDGNHLLVMQLNDYLTMVGGS